MDKNGVYSTNMYTEAVEQAIERHNSNKGFHAPLEIPKNYLHDCQSIPYKN